MSILAVANTRLRDNSPLLLPISSHPIYGDYHCTWVNKMSARDTDTTFSRILPNTYVTVVVHPTRPSNLRTLLSATPSRADSLSYVRGDRVTETPLRQPGTSYSHTLPGRFYTHVPVAV